MTTKRLEKFTLVLNPDTEYEEAITWRDVRVNTFETKHRGRTSEMTVSIRKIEEPTVPVTLPPMLPVIQDTDWRWSYEYNLSRWELQKYFADKWHHVQHWAVGNLFENPAASREHVRKILNQAGVAFGEQREPDPELERLLREEEDIAEQQRLDQEQEIDLRQADDESPEGL